MDSDFQKKGFTLVELIVTIALIVGISVVAVIVMNPLGQLARGRDSMRKSHVNTILNAVRQNIRDSRTGFSCGVGNIPTTSTRMATGVGNYDIAPCLVPTYLQKIPYDPNATNAHYLSITDYNSGYFIFRNATSGQITVSAPSAETTSTFVTR
jgi:prepilin-type N-terminal cleavage/methylation domain-containing protein